ncbi:MAG TPA: acyl-CoA thioesterase [Candidatus Latescibacteria bacterium]|nr:acyl-CoA thioesterase [Candidatus Latescibacterota bacterium]
MAYEFHTRRCIEFEDTDAAGIVHFARFHVFMEQAEHQFLRSLGASVHMEVDGELISWPRLASSCEFFHPVRFEDQLDVYLSVRRKGNKAITYECEFLVSDEEVAKGEITSVCCVCAPGERMRAIPIPSLIGDKIEQRPDQDLES